MTRSFLSSRPVLHKPKAKSTCASSAPCLRSASYKIFFFFSFNILIAIRERWKQSVLHIQAAHTRSRSASCKSIKEFILDTHLKDIQCASVDQ